jgi:hypothetical protein
MREIVSNHSQHHRCALDICLRGSEPGHVFCLDSRSTSVGKPDHGHLRRPSTRSVVPNPYSQGFILTPESSHRRAHTRNSGSQANAQNGSLNYHQHVEDDHWAGDIPASSYLCLILCR